MDTDLNKKFYKISEVAEILRIPASTLRFWERSFTVIRPHRNSSGIRLYTPRDIEVIRMIHYLVKEKGLKLEAAQEQIRHNRAGIDRRHETIRRLQGIRSELTRLICALDERKI